MAIATSGGRSRLAGVPGGADGIEGFVDSRAFHPKLFGVPGARGEAQSMQSPSREPSLLEVGTGVTPIEIEVSPATPHVAICQVLAAWRAAERELAGLSADSPEWGRVHALIIDHRTTYLRLFDERMRWGNVNGRRHDGSRPPGG